MQYHAPPQPSVATNAGAIDNSNVRSGYGTVESVERVAHSDMGLLGTIGGAVVGGLRGHQIGSGRGNTAATIAGAAGGAYAGHEIERRTRGDSDAYRIVVRMDDGSYQAVGQASQPSRSVQRQVHGMRCVARRYAIVPLGWRRVRLSLLRRRVPHALASAQATSGRSAHAYDLKAAMSELATQLPPSAVPLAGVGVMLMVGLALHAVLYWLALRIARRTTRESSSSPL